MATGSPNTSTEQVGTAVDHRGRLVEPRRHVDHPEHLHDPAHAVEVTELGVHRGQDRQSRSSAPRSAPRSRVTVSPDLARDDRRSVDRSVPADVEEVAGTDAAQVVPGGREHRRQLDAELGQSFRAISLISGATASRSNDPGPHRWSPDPVPFYRRRQGCGPIAKAECHSRENCRPIHWYFNPGPGRVENVIRAHGAPSIAQGVTPHEVRDELCSAVGGDCV